MASYRIEHDFVKAFGKDTLSSIAIYIRELKKWEDTETSTYLHRIY